MTKKLDDDALGPGVMFSIQGSKGSVGVSS